MKPKISPAVLLAFLLIITALPVSAEGITLGHVKKIYIEKMPNELDQYIRAEIYKQTKGGLVVVLEKSEADGVLTGISEKETGKMKHITGRYLGIHDNSTAAITLLDREEKTVLWADEAGDRSLIFGIAKRGGERKVAERIVKKLREAVHEAGQRK